MSGVPVRSGRRRTNRTPPVNISNSSSRSNNFNSCINCNSLRTGSRRPIRCSSRRGAPPKPWPEVEWPPEVGARIAEIRQWQWPTAFPPQRYWSCRRRRVRTGLAFRRRRLRRRCPGLTSHWPFPRSAPPPKCRCYGPVFPWAGALKTQPHPV